MALVLVLAACGSVSAARVEPDAAVMDAPQLDDLSLLQTDAQSQNRTGTAGEREGGRRASCCGNDSGSSALHTTPCRPVHARCSSTHSRHCSPALSFVRALCAFLFLQLTLRLFLSLRLSFPLRRLPRLRCRLPLTTRRRC